MVYNLGMARPSTTSDAFLAVAEPHRRRILDVLRDGERPVNDLVEALGVGQPQVSKHLRVLRAVGLVHVRGEGRQRIYALDADRLRAVFEWVKMFEPFWDRQLERIKARAEEAARRDREAGKEET